MYFKILFSTKYSYFPNLIKLSPDNGEVRLVRSQAQHNEIMSLRSFINATAIWFPNTFSIQKIQTVAPDNGEVHHLICFDGKDDGKVRLVHGQAQHNQVKGSPYNGEAIRK